MKIAGFYENLIVGSGCAGLAVAHYLCKEGQTDTAIITEGLRLGTSRNTGSDKQTYYKVSVAGNECDSPYQMAKTLYSGGAMDGDLAMCESTCSLKGFYNLESLGVKFPQNEFGEFVGYKTDHDPKSRASSVGPYTSKEMVEVLEKSVIDSNVKIFNKFLAVKVLVKNGQVYGLLSIDKTNTNIDYGLTLFRCKNIILATGGPAGIYYDSAYPKVQNGFSSLSILAGAEQSNLAEWQYGLASTKFRWNVSGSYQQVLPRYISIDENGVEREFLNDYFENDIEAINAVFLKGYQWPFDYEKINLSSKVDIAVYTETKIKNRRVFLDYTTEPAILKDGLLDKISKEAYDYLSNSNALVGLPIERLKRLNKKSYELYLDHGIDIAKDRLEIAVCSQHNNGGVQVDCDYQTNIIGLYVAGECAGVFGVRRPGGTALNSTQVSAIRISKHISNKLINEVFIQDYEMENDVKQVIDLIESCKGDSSTLSIEKVKMQKLMSENFSFLRNIDKMRSAEKIINSEFIHFSKTNKWVKDYEVIELLKNYDRVVTQLCYASSMIFTAINAGSRGGSTCIDEQGNVVVENKSFRKKKVNTLFDNGKIKSYSKRVKPIPKNRELWFEKVWSKTNK